MPPYHIAHRTHIPTITHIPKGAKAAWTKLFTSVCNRVASDPGNIANHILLSIVARVILPAGKSPPHPGDTSQASKIKDRIKRWKQGSYNELWEEAISQQKEPNQPRRKKKQPQEEVTQEVRNARRSLKLIKEGQYTRAAQALVSPGLAEQSRATVSTMESLHPQCPRIIPRETEPSSPPMRFSHEQVVKAVMTFKAGSAPGPSGLRAEHLKAATKSAPANRTDKAVEALTKMVNVLAAGQLPEEAAPYFSGARLYAGNKKSGGIRPIAVGDIIRRLVSKCFSYALAEKAASLLAPFQLGVGVRGGCEALVHTARALLEDPDTPKDSLNVMQLDLINAFNVADRVTAFEEVKELFPELARWMESTYGSQAELIFGEVIILSCQGFHQGDPLACLFFSVVLHHIIRRIAVEVPDLLLNGWFLDDGVCVGKLPDLAKVVRIILEDGPARGLTLSTRSTTPPGKEAKSTIWCPFLINPVQDPLGLGIRRISDTGIILLGTPLGSQTFVQERIREKIEAVRDITNHLPLIQDSHSEFVLLRSCFSLPKVMFLLRTIPSTLHLDLWKVFDNLIRDTLTHILGSTVDNIQWAQSQLPVAMGGLGLRSAEEHSAGAYISSVLSTESLKEGLLPHRNISISLVPSILYLNTKVQEELSEDDLFGMNQRSISVQIDLQLQSRLAESLTSMRDKARMASLSLAHSGDWINVVPSPVLGLHLRPQEFRYAMLYRLGVPIYSREGPCPACSKPSDRYGDHALACAADGERIARHNHLRDALFSVAASANLAPRKEMQYLLPGSNARPADVFIPCWSGGLDTALDVTVVCPLLPNRFAQAVETPGHTLTQAFNDKCRTTLQACQSEGIAFIPLPAETLGGWHPRAEDQIKKLARALARCTGREEEESIRHLFQKLGVILVRSNAAMFINRIPTYPSPEVDGYE